MQRPILTPSDLPDLVNARTRAYTIPSPNHPDGLGLFEGLPSPPPRKRLPKLPESSPLLRPPLTPWTHDWVTTRNDLNRDEHLDPWDDDLPDDDFSLGEPLEETNYWEKSFIQAKAEKKAAEVAKKANEASKRKPRKRLVPLSKAGRKRAWKMRAEGRLRSNGKFIKTIVIGED